jgi:hypothetical protein
MFLLERAQSSAGGGLKRKNVDDGGNMKRARQDGDGAGAGLGPSSKMPGFYELSSKRYAGVTSYAGKKLVDIREYFEKNGEMLPGSKGLSITEKQVEELGKIVSQGLVKEAMSEVSGDDTKSFKISPTRLITVRLFGGKVMVDLREHYEGGDGQLLPGKKGISLLQEQWEKLESVMPMLLEQIGSGELVTSKNNALTGDSLAAAPAVVAQPPASAVEPSVGQSQTKYQLSRNRFISLENWKGSDMIDLREYYEKDGEMRPGKKGISLSSSQARALESNIAMIDQAFSAQDEAFSVEISPRRKVTISLFKGTPMVNVREYYEKDGKLLPSTKGLSLQAEQWNACKVALQNLVRIMNP